jgi:biopolymer transport protein ExbB
VVGIAPLLGLVGTIHGLITLFADLGRVGVSDNTVLAKGIAIALNTTLAGLLIAIPSLVAWSYFNKKVQVLAIEMETLCDEFLRRFYPSGKKARS